MQQALLMPAQTLPVTSPPCHAGERKQPTDRSGAAAAASVSVSWRFVTSDRCPCSRALSVGEASPALVRYEVTRRGRLARRLAADSEGPPRSGPCRPRPGPARGVLERGPGRRLATPGRESPGPVDQRPPPLARPGSWTSARRRWPAQAAGPEWAAWPMRLAT
jgi:hypothetical protein